ncbi:cupredoxin domain-containing protein [Alicyclobacillus shizuokensis]|uniref:cupredoxin domain-containing protein n=1 Tax=Alicyclobacillus shizuokensis TaxID=392014 RepID=UPI00083391B0|nr:cupredoxin domain-containing protein [Alicyclobacillus shizuokensis]MCL6626724.1 cupredoxin domain-containing protein [Alicyclobacillus shizuokensis]
MRCRSFVWRARRFWHRCRWFAVVFIVLTGIVSVDPLPFGPFLQVPQVFAQTAVRVVLRDGAISPGQIEARVGQAVNLTVVNQGRQVHNLVIPDFYVFLPNLPAGGQTTASFTPDRSGRFPFYSDRLMQGKRVPEPGMRGTLVVR